MFNLFCRVKLRDNAASPTTASNAYETVYKLKTLQERHHHSTCLANCLCYSRLVMYSVHFRIHYTTNTAPLLVSIILSLRRFVFTLLSTIYFPASALLFMHSNFQWNVPTLYYTTPRLGCGEGSPVSRLRTFPSNISAKLPWKRIGRDRLFC